MHKRHRRGKMINRMKTSNVAILLLLSIVLETRGQGVAPAVSQKPPLPVATPYAVTARDANNNV